MRVAIAGAGAVGGTEPRSGSVTTVTRATAEPDRVRRTGGSAGSVAVSPVTTGAKPCGAASGADGTEVTTWATGGVSSTRTAVANAVPAEVGRRVRRVPFVSVPRAASAWAAVTCALSS